MEPFGRSECKLHLKRQIQHSTCLLIFVRSGTANDTRGTAFVVYEDIFDAKTACDHLQGFNILGRYLIVLYYQPNKVTKKANLQKKEAELQELKR